LFTAPPPAPLLSWGASTPMHRLEPESLPQHVDRLYRAAWALCGNKPDAEDLVQETIARVLSRPRYVRGSDLAYLMRGLHNTFLDGRRAAAARPAEVAMSEDFDAADGRVTWQPGEAIDKRELYGAVSALPDDFRVVLVAVDILGLSYSETAKLASVPASTVATRLHRARTRVAQALTGTNLESQPSLKVGAGDEK